MCEVRILHVPAHLARGCSKSPTKNMHQLILEVLLKISSPCVKLNHFVNHILLVNVFLLGQGGQLPSA